MNKFTNTKVFHLPPLRIHNRVPKHIQKSSPKEFVGELDGLLPFPADGVGFVQNVGDAFLF